jgi:hypothetical protein
MHIGERRKLEKQRYICTLGNQMSFLLLFKGWASSRTARQRGSRRWSWSRRPCWGPFAAATRKDRSSGAVSRVYWDDHFSWISCCTLDTQSSFLLCGYECAWPIRPNGRISCRSCSNCREMVALLQQTRWENRFESGGDRDISPENQTRTPTICSSEL